ncbi:hypothetical protein DFJ67_7037 [Asanoa ferruginea]|uniref:Vanadium-dependent haloperoxidase n=1 Tax=Asanoa ferruginea TaxID=53367 RepID=A0A3D9ZUS8_9ACTN|nr:vanadium-dependent haloperoxidase [Asanoa ferruginea]REG00966.1 hypothetical protein DFJ67_7037 [Asanoa ferruginea]GIF47565.1 hypothetical protein Afe04nite_21040 [Asanoa ferruginea]
MTILGRMGRRRLRAAAAVAVTAALLASLSGAVKAAPAAPTFDLDNGNALIGLIYPRFDTVARDEHFGRPMMYGGDSALLVEMPWFDALSPYHPTAVGIFSNLGRRPVEERTTRNKNIAVIYSAFTSLNIVFPQYKATWLEMMTTAGLDPNNTAADPATPSGIGILAARNAIAARKHDGSNRYGDEGGRKYNQQPYADYTGYRPVNTPQLLRDPSRWQPNIVEKREVFTAQEFATPQFGRMKPFSYKSPEQLRVARPTASDYAHNRRAYRTQADEVLEASAGLDDRKKMSAELFDDLVRPYGAVAGRIVVGGNLNTEDSIHYVVTGAVTGIDVTIASWYYKRKYDSVRPFSAIRHLYGEKKVTAWGGPGKGTVNDITGAEWQGYLSSLSIGSPEYPSAHAALCFSYAQQARRFIDTDSLEIFSPALKGSSLVEPGITPANDLTLHWSSLSAWADDCGQSRIWGGENFPASVDAARDYATEVGDLAYEFVQRKLNGG